MGAEKETWELALVDYKKKMPRKEIAAKYGVSENTVKSWQSRHWNKKKGAPKSRKKGAPTSKPKGAPNKGGAPKGNRNALGNSGGAPPGNQNGLQHGLYSQLFIDTLTPEERQAFDAMAVDPKRMLEEEIKLYTVRELRLMRRIAELEQVEKKKAFTVMGLHRSERKKELPRPEDIPDVYTNNPIEPAVEVEKGVVQRHSYHLNTDTIANIELIGRFENELSRVQRCKAGALAQYQRLLDEEGGEGSGRMDELMGALDKSREIMGMGDYELDDSGNIIMPDTEAVVPDG